VNSYQLPVKQPQLITDNWSLNTELPCLDSSPKCIEELTEAAIANSGELKTIEMQLGMWSDRDKLIDQRIKYARSRQWTNFLTLDPFKLVQTIFGGGDSQRSAIAISDLEIKKAALEAEQAGFLRRQAEVESQIREQILTLVLNYEAALRQATLIASQLDSQRILSQVVEIDYRYGNSSTESYLAALEKRERLENQLIQSQTTQAESLRKILSLTGMSLPESEIR
jgi:outer membrane protein TolC